MPNRQRHILLTNDDGFEAPGLHALKESLEEFARVTVVAPTIEKSACGHSLTLTRPLRFVEIGEDFYKLDDGTPSDCIFLAMNKLFKDTSKPDLIVSGINLGANMGEDITYSGTAAAAMEGVLQGVPSVAFSQVCRGRCSDIDLHYRLARECAVEIVRSIFEKGFPLSERRFLNVNIPPVSPEEFAGYRFTYAGRRVYGNDAEVHINPRGLEYFWIGLPRLEWMDSANPDGHISDFEAIEADCVSITPVKLDMTAYDDLQRIEGWL